MLVLSNNLIRVRCIECQRNNYINLVFKSVEKVQRSISYEYEYLYNGTKDCICGETLKLSLIVFEYPKGIYNYSESNVQSCLLMEDIVDSNFIEGEL